MPVVGELAVRAARAMAKGEIVKKCFFALLQKNTF